MTPTEIARETLLRLATEKLAPTPENYTRLYQEIAGLQTEPITDSAQPDWGHLLQHSLPADHPHAEVERDRIQQALNERDWLKAVRYACEYGQERVLANSIGQEWGTLFERFVQEWEAHQPGLTQSKKRQALQRVLAMQAGASPIQLYQKLNNLVQGWAKPMDKAPALPPVAADLLSLGMEELEAEAERAAAAGGLTLLPPELPVGWERWRAMLAETLYQGVAPRFHGFPELQHELEHVSRTLDGVSNLDEQELLARNLKKLWIKTAIHQQHEERIVNGLVNLLDLLLENLDELAGSDRHLGGQIEAVRTLLTCEVMTMRAIYQLEASLKEVIYKQGLLKHSLDQATDSLRDMLNTFTQRLSMMVDHTDQYQNRIQGYTEQLQTAQDPIALGQIVDYLMSDTRSIQVDLVSARDELLATRQRVESAEYRIQELEQALDAASAKIKEDQLTGAYNRRGLEEIFARERARQISTGRPLSLALIDIDNFKQLNDRYGHLAGDDALKHLVAIAQEKLRPTDIVARFGGEEFVVLMPETSIVQALDIIRRLQRELTKAFFMANNDRLVLTFSAGVAACGTEETEIEIIDRADRAMYAAKMAGKNRVFAANENGVDEEGSFSAEPPLL